MKTKFVYFDVGGVLLLDYSGTSKWVEMKRDLGVTTDLDEKFDEVWKRYWSRVCIDCDVDNILSDFEKEVGIIIPENYSMLVDFVNRFEANDSIWSLAHAVKEKYKTGLLTNQYPRMLNLIKEKNLMPDVDWDVVIDSSVVGHQKPEQAIFELAEEKANHHPNEILFIDNSLEHLEGANKKGWKTFLYNLQNVEESNKQLIEVLDL